MAKSEFLEKIGRVFDADIPLAETALQFSLSARPGLDIGRYRHHLEELTIETAARFKALIEAGAQDDAGTRMAALKHVISDKYKYEGDHENFHDLQNADLSHVIDRRKGLPITLSILALHIAAAQNWQLEGLNFPGHFLLRLTHGAERLIADPFENFTLMDAPDLRNLIKKIAGPEAELSASYYEPATNRDILIRLQNNIKFRLIADEDYEAALLVARQMMLIAPDDYRVMFDTAVLEARNGGIPRAIELLERYLDVAPASVDLYDAQLFLSSLKTGLH